MTKLDTVEAWQERDAEFERGFKLGNSPKIRHVIGRLFGQNKAPNLNEYRDHLIEGNVIGALRVEGMPRTQELLDRFASEDHEQCVVTPGQSVLQTKLARRVFAKLIMDLQAGKISLGSKESGGS